MDEDGGEVFEGEQNRSTQHIHQNLEHCTGANHFRNLGTHTHTEKILHSGVIQGKSEESYHMLCDVTTDKIT